MQFLIATVTTLVVAAALAFGGHAVAAGIVASVGFTVLMGAFVLWEEFRPRRRRPKTTT